MECIEETLNNGQYCGEMEMKIIASILIMNEIKLFSAYIYKLILKRFECTISVITVTSAGILN